MLEIFKHISLCNEVKRQKRELAQQLFTQTKDKGIINPNIFSSEIKESDLFCVMADVILLNHDRVGSL